MIIRSISGVRGITETHLTPESAVVYARALHQILPIGVIYSVIIVTVKLMPVKKIH